MSGQKSSKSPRNRWLGVALGVSAIGLAGWWWLQPEPDFVTVGTLARFDPASQLRSNEDTLAEARLAQAEIPDSRKVERGQTLFGVFEQLGLERDQANDATFAVQQHMDPRKLRAGTEFAVYRRPDASLSRVVFPIDRRGEVQVRPSADGWSSHWREYRVEERVQTVRGRLDRDLSSAMQAAGAPYSLSTALADVLQWDLDFNRDLRLGDEFEVMYTGRWVEGRFEGVKTVHAALYKNRGRVVEAYQFGENGGYYDSEGRPLRKQFLKSPLPFTRVTSNFSHSRLHPVLKVRRPHYGVDYGAPTGTPVRATANGTVSYRGRTKGAGNMIKVRHPNGFETSYLHLSKFHSNACRGCRVSQGELIGYVGSTGLSTGPHLDYRVKRNGRYLNPLQLPNTPAEPIPGAQREAFYLERDMLRQQLTAEFKDGSVGLASASVGSASDVAP